MAKPKPQKKKVVSAPAAKSTPARQLAPRTVTVSERERVATVNGSVGFTVALSHVVNPGLIASFPWLSAIANQYEKYRVKKLVYRYRNIKGTSSPGNVLLTFDKDVTDTAPGTALEITQSSHYTDGPVWDSLVLQAKIDNETRYVRSAAVPSADLRLSDLGVLYVGMEGCADASVHGYIEAEYTIEFMEKNAGGSGGRSANRQVTEFRADGSFAGAMTLMSLANGINVPFTSTSCTIPPGAYIISLLGGDVNSGGAVFIHLGGVQSVVGTNDHGPSPTEVGKVFSRVVTVTAQTALTVVQTGTGTSYMNVRLELL